jgi:4-hydroxythreonine-4-phosphate dehydrogenase
MKPTLALFTGDPGGIGPEVVAKILADDEVREAANFILIGSRKVIERGMEVAGKRTEFHHIDPRRPNGDDLPVQLARWDRDGEVEFELGNVDARNGAHMLAGLALGLKLCVDGIADAMCVAPLNKSALKAGGMKHPDEINYFREVLSHTGPATEFNVSDKLWTARVTSHVAIKDVSSLITHEKIVNGITVFHEGLSKAGYQKPRIAVCGLNPHNGESGAFGSEEIEVIRPAVEHAKSLGFNVHGPFPADTVFVQAIKENGGFDGVLTMYHDQGQIAMKLMSFGRGVTVHYGLPMVVTTTSHGTAYDIVERGIATPEALKNAALMAARMGAPRGK